MPDCGRVPGRNSLVSSALQRFLSPSFISYSPITKETRYENKPTSIINDSLLEHVLDPTSCCMHTLDIEFLERETRCGFSALQRSDRGLPCGSAVTPLYAALFTQDFVAAGRVTQLVPCPHLPPHLDSPTAPSFPSSKSTPWVDSFAAPDALNFLYLCSISQEKEFTAR